LCDDLNTPVALAALFEMVTWIHNAVASGKPVAPQDKEQALRLYERVVNGILGLKEDKQQDQQPLVEGLMHMILDVRTRARAQKDWETSDKIRDGLSGLGITVKDTSGGTEWEI
jgi:cysteinyl-tRNA synthetase